MSDSAPVSVLQIELLGTDDAPVIALVGELDISNAHRVEQELRRLEDRGPEQLILDLSRLTFLDSTGLRLVVSADARAREAGRRFRVVKGPERIHRVFELTFVDRRLEFTDPEDIPGES